MNPFVPILASCLLVSACGGGGGSRSQPAPLLEPRPVSILVEVYDPFTNFVWENVTVRVLEADQEWFGGTFPSPYQDGFLTDPNGRVLLDEYLLADQEVGFVLDGVGRAILGPRLDQDEALVVLEVSGVGFTPVIVEVPLRWDQPDVFVEVPFF